MVFLPIKSFIYFNPKDWLGSHHQSLVWKPKLMLHGPKLKNLSSLIPCGISLMAKCFKTSRGLTIDTLFMRKMKAVMPFCSALTFLTLYWTSNLGKRSVSIISLVCLNLPPDICYKPEHMCLVGIMPGPHEPPLMTLNHYLTPLVNNFLDFWHLGMWFNGYKHGRLVLCAIACIVCDLPVAPKASGFGPSSHSHICAICHCTHQTHGYGNISCHLWCRCTKEECLASAKTFNEARTKSEQEVAFTSSGVKWLELFHLPYFAHFVVIDAMHNLILGLINEHFKNILGIWLDKDKELSGSTININFINPQWEFQKEAEKKDGKKLLRC